MQSNRTPLVIAVIAVLVVAGTLYYYYEQSKPAYDWSETSWQKKTGYAEDNVQPYGTNIAHRLLKKFFPGKKLNNLTSNIASELPADSVGKGDNYVFIGEALYLDSLGTDRLLRFVEAGNTAFISSKTIPFDLMNYVYFEECEEAYWNDYNEKERISASLSLRTPALPDSTYKYFFAVKNKPTTYNWHFIDTYVFCDSLPHYPLGYFDTTYVNYAVFPYGNGRFLLHTTPLAFTNFSMLRAENRPYAMGVWSHLSNGDIYWDAVSRVPEAVGRRRNGTENNRQLSDEHPLTYILKQPALAWAWYLLACTAGLWLLFRAKRRQAIIPVLKKNENSSYEFIGTIANLHFREKNYKALTEQGMKLFLTHIRERFGLVAVIDPQNNLPRTDDHFFNRLSSVTDIPQSDIRKIFTQYTATVQYEPNEQMMVDLHQAIEGFWQRADAGR
jgi:hypothetical protein